MGRRRNRKPPGWGENVSPPPYICPDTGSAGHRSGTTACPGARRSTRQPGARSTVNPSVSVSGEFFTCAATKAGTRASTGHRRRQRQAHTPLSVHCTLQFPTMARSPRAEFWPFCVVFIIINDIRDLLPLSHDVFETHNNPNETLWVGNILLRASSGR